MIQSVLKLYIILHVQNLQDHFEEMLLLMVTVKMTSMLPSRV